ncbi:MAG: carboxypeptidase regulatory-like domain-containing protein [Gemmatimonadota bacterium]|nr:carboxypeptidase regulatory-like domain-containing protein [Gemmatimonadota bacterium]
MRITRWVPGVAVALAALLSGRQVSAQGVTTGAISGTVTNEQSLGVEGVRVQVRNNTNGATAGTLTRADGRYFIQGLEVGGPYTVTARRIGYAPQTQEGIRVSLGGNSRIDFRLSQQAAQLTGVTVTGQSEGAIISTAHKGAATTITDSSVSRLPTLNRNFTDFVSLTPQISTKGPGNSGGGQNNRFNAIQIDGSVANDLFGLGSTGQPGGQANAKQVPLAAVKEYQVLLSPYDVRQGNFTGALINAVTKSGGNELHGEVFGVTRNQHLERNVAYLQDAPFKQSQYGFWVGGPIIKDKLHFSIAPEWQTQSQPVSAPYFGQPSSVTVTDTVSHADYDRFTSILNSKGYTDVGSGDLVTNTNPLSNFFARFDLLDLPGNSRLLARYNYAGAQTDIFSRTQTAFKSTSNAYNFKSATNSGLAQLFTNMANGSSNELLVGYTTIRDKRRTPINAPMVTVLNVPKPGGTTSLVAGTENSSQGNELDQDILEFTDNYTTPIGTHRITLGTKNEWFKVRNLFAQNSLGNYTFGSLDSLNLGLPNRVQIGLKLDNSDGAARFTARTLGFYAEDEWQASPNLSLQYGLRLDLPGLTSAPGLNLLVLDSLGVNTSNVPKNVVQWSPRLGFNWDVNGDQVNQVRGGVGVFVGRPAYVWLSNAFGNSGVNGYANITCTSAATSPAFPGATGPVPANCRGTTATPAITVNTLDPNLKFPQTFRGSIGYDRRLPWEVVATFEGIYTKSLQNFFYDNINLSDQPLTTDSHGRLMYGVITGNNIAASYKKRGISDVINLTNQSQDYAYNLTAQLQKRFSNSFEGQLAYTYGHSYDVASMTSSVAYSNWQFGRSVKGDIHAADLTTSKFDSPHRIIADGTYSFPSKTDISFIFNGESGTPFDFVYSGDMNGDGSTSNDLIYVPTNATVATEIQFSQNGALTPAAQAAAFETFIASNDCLNAARGTIMDRNTCRTPWAKRLDVDIRQSLPTIRGQNFMLQLDIFNFLNLLNRSWGAQDIGSSNSPTILTRRSFNGKEGVFNFNPSFSQFSTQNIQSNYAMQLQLKYTF